jgi:hypothetical protein
MVRGDDGFWKFVQTGESFFPENDRLGNFFPACRACNIDKSVYPLEDWRKLLEERPNVCRRNYSAFRHAERFGRIVVINEPVIFFFEKYVVAHEAANA